MNYQYQYHCLSDGVRFSGDFYNPLVFRKENRRIYATYEFSLDIEIM